MDRHTDLPLFRWTPPAEVIPFPTSRRIGKIRQAALGILNAPTGRAEAAIWLRMTGAMEAQMRKAGVAEDRIVIEMRSFFEATQQEINRRQRSVSRDGGGDVA